MDTKMRFFSSGQAMIELAIGMLALSLVLAAIFGFAEYITNSLNAQRSLRAKAGKSAMSMVGGDNIYSTANDTTTFSVEPFVAEYIFGSREVKVDEKVSLPVMGGLLQ